MLMEILTDVCNEDQTSGGDDAIILILVDDQILLDGCHDGTVAISYLA